jgi:hypothetical protein
MVPAFECPVFRHSLYLFQWMMKINSPFRPAMAEGVEVTVDS